MSLEKGRITGIQLIFLVTAFVYGSILLTSFTTSITKQNTWLIVVTAVIVSIPFSITFSLLAKRFFGMNFIQILYAVYGPYIGAILSLIYILNFLLDLMYNTRDLGDFYMNFLITDTPIVFFITIFIFVCAYAVNKGIELLAHISHIICTVTILVVISTFLLLLKDMNFSNFLPVMEISPIKIIQGTHIMSIVSFGETIVFFNIMCCLKNKEHLIRNNLFGLLIAWFTLFIITVRNTASLGYSETILVSPSFQANRLINIGTIFTRLDILIAIANTMTMFFKCSVIYYSTVICISQFFHLRNYKVLIIPIGGIVIIGACIIFTSTLDHAEAGQGYVMIYNIATMYLLPVLTLMISIIRKLPRLKKE